MVSGRVQGAGYRDFVADVGRALKLVGFVENVKDGTVRRVRCKGEASTVEKFKGLINVKALLIEVESMDARRILAESRKRQNTSSGTTMTDVSTTPYSPRASGRRYGSGACCCSI